MPAIIPLQSFFKYAALPKKDGGDGANIRPPPLVVLGDFSFMIVEDSGKQLLKKAFFQKFL